MSTTVKFKKFEDAQGDKFIAVGRNGLFQATGVHAWSSCDDMVVLGNLNSRGETGRHSLVIPRADAVAVVRAILKEAGKKMPLSERDQQLRKLGLVALELMRRVGDYGDLSAADYVGEMCSAMDNLGFKDEEIMGPEELAARSES